MCLIDVRPKKQTKIMGDRTMKKTFIPMAILVATLLTGCQASDTIANANNIANDIVNETTASAVVEETNTDSLVSQVVEPETNILATPATTVVDEPVINDLETQPIETEDFLVSDNASVVTPDVSDSATTNDNSVTTSKLSIELENYPAYKNVIADLRQAFSTGSLNAISPSIENYYENYTGQIYIEETITVSLFDVNNDGTPELFFSILAYNSPGMVILDMYTLSGDEAIKVISDDNKGFYAYDPDMGHLFHLDDTQILDVLELNGTSIEIIESYIPDENRSYAKGYAFGTFDILSIL